MPEILLKILIFISGAIVGSFLNVCIHRLPLGESVVRPKHYYCPNCKKTILWYDNIPLLSYLFLRARCRFCRQPIVLRYFLVELITALVFWFFFNLYGIKFNFFFYTLLTCGLVVATFVDIRHRIIPDDVSIGGIVAGLLLSAARGLAFAPLTYNFRPLLNSFLGVIVGGGIIYLTGWLFDLFYFKLLKKPPIQGETESMGCGDVKLLAMIGAFLGWEKAILVFFLAPILGLAFGIVNLLTKKDHTIPYGPFLSLAAFLSIFWADKIISFIFLSW